MGNDLTQKNLFNGLAAGMEKNADNIAKEEQLIRDAIQPLGRIVPEKEQECLNTITTPLLEDIKHKREIASQIRKIE